jgi:hypothetical protein
MVRDVLLHVARVKKVAKPAENDDQSMLSPRSAGRHLLCRTYRPNVSMWTSVGDCGRDASVEERAIKRSETIKHTIEEEDMR